MTKSLKYSQGVKGSEILYFDIFINFTSKTIGLINSILLVNVYLVSCTMSSYSKLLSMSSCLRTLVWLVSLSSPAKNISSTMLYTL